LCTGDTKKATRVNKDHKNESTHYCEARHLSLPFRLCKHEISGDTSSITDVYVGYLVGVAGVRGVFINPKIKDGWGGNLIKSTFFMWSTSGRNDTEDPADAFSAFMT